MTNSKERALKKLAGSRSYFPKMGSKSQALEYFKAKKGKKKLPTFIHSSSHKESPYKKLSIEEYESKYL